MMKQLLGLMLLLFVAAAGWRIGGSLSSDAMGMAIGMLFGIMAGIPTALLLLAAERRREPPRDLRQNERVRDHPGQLAYGQPPVIVVTGAPSQLPPPYGPVNVHQTADSPGFSQADWSQSHSAPVQRTFRIVGERNEALDDW